MGGKEARDGYWFQDATALARLLRDAIDWRARIATGEELGDLLEVRVEATVDPGPVAVQGVYRPSWDSTYVRAGTVTVDESKLSDLSPKERRVFYRRIRATLASGVAVETLYPRLTIARGGLTNAKKWHSLAAEVRTATPQRPSRRTSTAKRLAAEALFYLTDPKVFTTVPLSLEDARAVLGRLVVDDRWSVDEVEQELKRAISIARGDDTLPPDQAIDQLRGWIDRAARAKQLPAVLSWETLSREVAIIAKALEIPQAVQELWGRLRKVRPPLPPSTIPMQGWRDVQPDVGAVSRRRVFTGPGGAGKSYLLSQLHDAAAGVRIWIDAQVTPGLEAAIAFGAWACAIREEPLSVFIDALDAVASPGEFLAATDRALAGRDAVVAVAARHTTWAEARDRLPGWEEIPLAGWSHERVRQLAEQNRSAPLSPDLVELLRTPLLLDLFLRTFGSSEEIPSGLATRHGVLRAYFERSVLPTAHRAAGQRRAALDRGASAILRNTSRWLDPSDEAVQLVAEGVFVLRSGELTFRHALLRDFAVSLFLGRHDAVGIAEQLALVSNPTIRNDLLRGVLEARMDPASMDTAGPPVGSLVRACMARMLSPGMALGSSDAPTVALVAMLAPLEDGAAFSQTLDRARLVENRIWIRVIASIGGARPPWLGDVQLDAISRLAAYALESQDPAGEPLARCLRGWTYGQLGDTWAMTSILKLVVRKLPDDETLVWIASLHMRAVVATGELLDDLRHMLVTHPGLDVGQARRALSNLVLDPEAADGAGHHRWSVVNRCLLSDGPLKPGLLAKRPEIALPIVFELGVREAERERRRDAQIWAKIERGAASVSFKELFPSRPPELEEVEASLKREPPLSEAEAFGGLFDDAPRIRSHRMDDLGRLFNAASNLARDAATASAVATAAESSRSIRARLLVLDRRSAAGLEPVQALLEDPRIYHSLKAQQAIHDSIIRYWDVFSAEAREQIQRNILNVARSPMLRVIAVGDLATAIPRAALDLQLVPYLELYEQEQRYLRSAQPRTLNVSPGESGDVVVRALSAHERDEAFVRLQGSIKALSAGEAQQILSEIIERDLLPAASDEDWFSISKVLEHDEVQAPPRLSGACTRAIFDAALARARTAGGRDLSLWTTLIDIADSAAIYIEHRADPAMRSALFAEVAEAAGQDATHREHVDHALMFIRGWHWSRTDSSGRELFLRWFREALGAEALDHALHHLGYFGLNQGVELITHVMETPGRLEPEGPHLRSLAKSVGQIISSWCMWFPDPAARDLFARWRAERPDVLSSVGTWQALIDGFAWQLQHELGKADEVDVEWRDAGIERFAVLADAAWQAWPPPGENDYTGIAWSLLSPLADDFQGPPRPWSYMLRSLLISILSTAHRTDLSAALHGLGWSRLDEVTLVAAVEAVIERSQRAGEDPLAVLDIIEALEEAGSLRELPVSTAYRVFDGLQALGTRFPRATAAASKVERRIRLEGV